MPGVLNPCGSRMPDISDREITCVLRADHKSRVHRSAPPVHVWAPEFESGAEAACGECGHPWAAHSKVYGCEMGWLYDTDDLATADGCECHLAHIFMSASDE